jgi:hypothetical protein
MAHGWPTQLVLAVGDEAELEALARVGKLR